MEYSFWWDVATYGNTAWKGGFSEREVAENAYEYTEEWKSSTIDGNVSKTIKGVLRNLKEDKYNLEMLATTMNQLYTLRKVEGFIEEIESEIEYEKLTYEKEA